MNFSELKQELADRGFTYLSDTRRGLFVNRAKNRLDNMYRWVYREATSSGAAPLTISDLGQIETVTTTTTPVPLCEASRIDLIKWYGDLTTLGTPYYWYRTGAANTQVAVYPVSTNSITVNYWKQTADLTGIDTPTAPSRFHLLYVDLAVQMAYRDSDNHASAEALWGEINRQILEMIEDLLPQHQPLHQEVGWWGSEDW